MQKQKNKTYFKRHEKKNLLLKLIIYQKPTKPKVINT